VNWEVYFLVYNIGEIKMEYRKHDKTKITNGVGSPTTSGRSFAPPVFQPAPFFFLMGE